MSSAKEGRRSGSWQGSRVLVHLGVASAAAGALCLAESPAECEIGATPDEVVTNWSATHRVTSRRVYRPETLEELEEVVAEAHKQGRKIRPVGSAISPNGIALSEEGMLNMGLMDQVLSVDQSTGRVTVQAGARVEQVVEALRPYGLTLQNYASVREQQIGGFIQVGAHGTGARIPPVDEQVVALKLVTPALGTLDLSPSSRPDLFPWARCALGALGVVAEVTLRAVPAYLLFEETFVSDARTVRKHHRDWLRKYKHIRYMWIPYTGTIVVVRSNPLAPASQASSASPTLSSTSPSPKAMPSPDAASPRAKASLALLLSMLCSATPNCAAKTQAALGDAALERPRELYRAEAEKRELAAPPSTDSAQGATEAHAGSYAGTGSAAAAAAGRCLSEEQLRALSFTELRDELLALNPLDPAHVARVNAVEADFWAKSQGFRVGWSDQILGFDCGGQQWVSEVAFPVPWAHASLDQGSATSALQSEATEPDLDFVEKILGLINSAGIPAPAPIEQRWTCGSMSPLSPASVGPGRGIADELYSWVGIIMYLPSSDPIQRQAITNSFMKYKMSTAKLLWDAYEAQEHWAKIEVPEDRELLSWIRGRLHHRFPLGHFAKLRRELDPKGILVNEKMTELLNE